MEVPTWLNGIGGIVAGLAGLISVIFALHKSTISAVEKRLEDRREKMDQTLQHKGSRLDAAERELASVKSELHDHKIHVAENYPSKVELREIVTDALKPIHDQIERLSNHLMRSNNPGK